MEFGDMFLCQTNNRGLLKLKKVVQSVSASLKQPLGSSICKE